MSQKSTTVLRQIGGCDWISTDFHIQPRIHTKAIRPWPTRPRHFSCPPFLPLMWVAERHRRILDLLQTHHRLTTEHFAEALSVSKETVRRDLIELERSGQLARVHGGAVPP